MPQLIVFCKGKPEEAVLCVCKTHGTRGGNSFHNNTCKPQSWFVANQVSCQYACVGVTGS